MTGDVISQVTDKELTLRVQAHDPEAFGMLYDRLAPRAFRVATCGAHERATRARWLCVPITPKQLREEGIDESVLLVDSDDLAGVDERLEGLTGAVAAVAGI